MGVGVGDTVEVGDGVGLGLGVGVAVGVGVGLAWAVASIAAVTVATMSGVGAAVGSTVGVASLPQAAKRRNTGARTPQRNGFTGLFICFPSATGRDHKGDSQGYRDSTHETPLWQMARAYI